MIKITLRYKNASTNFSFEVILNAMHTDTCIYIYIERERNRERER